MEVDESVRYTFQFQTGAIRSVRGAMNCATTSQEDKGFNSKLVRLEACNAYRDTQ